MSESSKPNRTSATVPSPAPEEECAESGVDRSLIRWMLSLSPTERLIVIQQQVNAVQEMKEQIDSD